MIRLIALFRKYSERGGKSGQCRAPYFLTGRGIVGDDSATDSATENKLPVMLLHWGKR